MNGDQIPTLPGRPYILIQPPEEEEEKKGGVSVFRFRRDASPALPLPSRLHF